MMQQTRPKENDGATRGVGYRLFFSGSFSDQKGQVGPSLEASAVYPFSRMMQLRPNSILHRNSKRFSSSIRSHIPMYFLILMAEVKKFGNGAVS